MNDNVPLHRAGSVVNTGKASITPADTRELGQLFDHLADTCDAASQTLGSAGSPPTGSQFQRVKELNARVDAMVGRIKAILG
jgi:hypothetical protein